MARKPKETETEQAEQSPAPSAPDLSEVDRRMEMALAYKAVVLGFDSAHPVVTEELKAYAKLRLEQLLGIRSESPDAFSGTQTEILKKLADAASRKYTDTKPGLDIASSGADPRFNTEATSSPTATLQQQTSAILQKPVAIIPRRAKLIAGQIQGPGMAPMPSGASAASIMTAQAAETLELNSSFSNQMAMDSLKR